MGIQYYKESERRGERGGNLEKQLYYVIAPVDIALLMSAHRWGRHQLKIQNLSCKSKQLWQWSGSTRHFQLKVDNRISESEEYTTTLCVGADVLRKILEAGLVLGATVDRLLFVSHNSTT